MLGGARRTAPDGRADLRTCEEARPSRDGPPLMAAIEVYLCFLAGVKLLALAMTADGSVVMQMA
jgi:hypothetical protein